MKVLKIMAVPVVALSLVACQGSGTKQTLGTLGGAAAGGLIGSQIGSGSGRVAAILAGVLIGGLIGNQIGKALDDQDREYARQASQQSLSYAPTGSSSAWRNPESGNSGNFRPTSGAYTNPNGQTCRKFEHEIVLKNGERQVVRGTGCQKADGSWDTN